MVGFFDLGLAQVGVERDHVADVKTTLFSQGEHCSCRNASLIDTRVAAQHPGRDVGVIARCDEIGSPQPGPSELLDYGADQIEPAEHVCEEDRPPGKWR